MRRIFLLLAMTAATLVVASGVALAATPGDPDRPLVVGRSPNVVVPAATSGDPNSDAKVTKEGTNAQKERVGFNFGKIVWHNGSWAEGQTGGGGKNELRFDDTPGKEGQTVGHLKLDDVVGESR